MACLPGICNNWVPVFFKENTGDFSAGTDETVDYIRVSEEWGSTVHMGVCRLGCSTVHMGVCIKLGRVVQSWVKITQGVRINFHCTYKSIMRTMYLLMRKASRNITILSLFTLRRISNSWSDSSLSASSSYLMILAT